jgi:hypothetical protein
LFSEEETMGAGILIQILELGISEIVPIEGLIARLHSIFTLNPDVKVNIQHLSSEAIQADDDTLQQVADWQTAHGLPVTVKPPTPIVQAPALGSPSAGPVLVGTGTTNSTPGGSSSPAAPDGAASGSASDAAAAPANHGAVGDLGTNRPAPKV